MMTGKLIAVDRRVDRRTVLGGAAGLAAAGIASHLGASSLTAAQESTPATGESGRETFVLVHGAYAGAWVWKKVIPLLRAADHDVFATTATGMGDRAHLTDPRIDLDVFITDVVNLMEYEELTDVTLVGWSFGGMIITGVAEVVPERLKQLVYLDAAVPEDGQSNYTLSGFGDDVLAFEYWTGLEAGWTGYEIVHPGVQEFVRSLAKDPADAEWLLSKLHPQPLATQTQPVTLVNPAAAALPRVYVLCTEGRAEGEDPFIEQMRADPGWQVVELADNHFAPVNAPELTAEALLSLV
jgi:pimeloyl-ACP methyl ester carboxylesterase